MTNNINLNSVSGAIIPYTPPKSAEEFVNGEVVKKAHEIFERAIRFQECKFLKVSDDLFLRWKHLANTNPISESDDFFSILRNEDVLLPLFSFLDRNSLQNLTLCAKNVKENVDQYVEQGFEHYFGMSCEKFQESVNDYSFDELSKMLNKAIKKDAPEIVFEKFLSILLPTTDQIEFEEILYPSLQNAIENHASIDTILAFLRATTRFGKICNEDDPIDLLELTLKERIATPKLVEALLKVGCELNSFSNCTMCVAVKYGASSAVKQTIQQAMIQKVNVNMTLNDAIDCHASAKKIQLFLDAGCKVDEGKTYPSRKESSIYHALKHNAMEVVRLLKKAGASIKVMGIN